MSASNRVPTNTRQCPVCRSCHPLPHCDGYNGSEISPAAHRYQSAVAMVERAVNALDVGVRTPMGYDKDPLLCSTYAVMALREALLQLSAPELKSAVGATL